MPSCVKDSCRSGLDNSEYWLYDRGCRNHHREGHKGKEIEYLTAHPRIRLRVFHHFDTLHHMTAIEIIGKGKRGIIQRLANEQRLVVSL